VRGWKKNYNIGNNLNFGMMAASKDQHVLRWPVNTRNIASGLSWRASVFCYITDPRGPKQGLASWTAGHRHRPTLLSKWHCHCLTIKLNWHGIIETDIANEACYTHTKNDPTSRSSVLHWFMMIAVILDDNHVLCYNIPTFRTGPKSLGLHRALRYVALFPPHPLPCSSKQRLYDVFIPASIVTRLFHTSPLLNGIPPPLHAVMHSHWLELRLVRTRVWSPRYAPSVCRSFVLWSWVYEVVVIYQVHLKIWEFVEDPVKRWNDIVLVTSVHFVVHITDFFRE
jgi:hypothetical protein